VGWLARRFGFALFALSFAILGVQNAQATDGLVMPASGDACKSTRMDAEHAAEESEWRCAGPNGFSLKYNDVVTQGGVSIAYRGKDLPDQDMRWSPAQSGIGSRVEWRIKDGMPIAAIIGRWRRPEEAQGSTDAVVEELLILKVTPTSACAVAVIGGLQPQAMATARDTADRKATGFRCGVGGARSAHGALASAKTESSQCQYLTSSTTTLAAAPIFGRFA
jgi:hypothetical protein